MNAELRIKMIKAMEFIVRNVNSEAVTEGWLSLGVADGDVKYGDLTVSCGDAENMDCYIKDEDFAEIMGLFLSLMHQAEEDGGLYCDGVVSEETEV